MRRDARATASDETTATATRRAVRARRGRRWRARSARDASDANDAKNKVYEGATLRILESDATRRSDDSNGDATRGDEGKD